MKHENQNESVKPESITKLKKKSSQMDKTHFTHMAEWMKPYKC